MKFSEDNLYPLISDDNKVTGYGLDNQRFSSKRAKSFHQYTRTGSCEHQAFCPVCIRDIANSLKIVELKSLW